jgi:hypothetical protein
MMDEDCDLVLKIFRAEPTCHAYKGRDDLGFRRALH